MGPAPLTLAAFVGCVYLLVRAVAGAVYSHRLANWEFERGLEGWAASTQEEMDAEIYSRGGEMVGNVHGARPHMDSPRLHLSLRNDDHWVVVRMKFSGGGNQMGGVVVRMKSMEFAAPTINVHDDPTEAKDKLWQWEEDDAGVDDATWDWSKDGVFIPFDEQVVGDGKYRIYHARVWKRAKGTLQQLRLLPAVVETEDDLVRNFRIDWVRIVKAPTIRKVEGCIDKYFNSSNLGFGDDQAGGSLTSTRAYDGAFVHRGSGGGFASISFQPVYANGNGHQIGSTIFSQMDEKPYSTTYNCRRSGKEIIRITGSNLGSHDASDPTDRPIVTIDGKRCTDVSIVVPQKVIECLSPVCRKCRDRIGTERLEVKVAHPDLPGVYGARPYFSYATRPPKVLGLTVSNIAARSVTLHWRAPDDFWDALTITGYVVQRREVGRPSFGNDVIVGNVTTTTLIGLNAHIKYEFRIAGLVEDQRRGREMSGETAYEWLQLDLYGRRDALPGAIVGVFSDPTDPVLTLKYDIHFTHFDANATLNHKAVNKAANQTTKDPLRVEGGEGHYGIRLVGDANIENCNASHACCDFGGPNGTTCNLMCTNIQSTDAMYLNGEVVDREVYTNEHSNGIFIGKLSDVFQDYADVYDVTSSCGGALRLTASHAKQTGAAWYPRKMNVREGFDTTFTFHLSNPSLTCDLMDDVHTRCRSRGADGFAFVIQNEDELALGRGGMSLGYGGIANGLAVEFDTYFNYENLDPYENHIAVISEGWRRELTSNHTSSFGDLVDPPDLANEIHTARIVYSPEFDVSALEDPQFTVTGQHTHFLTNAQYPDGGMADFGTGMGTLKVYVNDMHRPLLITPIKLDALLRLDSGRAWVGFTAATGDERWQTHDILTWTFTSARIDVPYSPPLAIGHAHECIAGSENECVHK